MARLDLHVVGGRSLTSRRANPLTFYQVRHWPAWKAFIPPRPGWPTLALTHTHSHTRTHTLTHTHTHTHSLTHTLTHAPLPLSPFRLVVFFAQMAAPWPGCASSSCRLNLFLFLSDPFSLLFRPDGAHVFHSHTHRFPLLSFSPCCLFPLVVFFAQMAHMFFQAMLMFRVLGDQVRPWPAWKCDF